MVKHLCKRLSEAYGERYNRIKTGDTAPDDKSSFIDAGNLVQGMAFRARFSNLYQKVEPTSVMRELLLDSLALEDYFHLLEHHPHYREFELYGNQMEHSVGLPEVYERCITAQGTRERIRLFGEGSHIMHHYILCSQRHYGEHLELDSLVQENFLAWDKQRLNQKLSELPHLS